MRKGSTIRNALIVLFIFVGIAILGMPNMRRSINIQTSVKFAEEAILAMADTWDANELARRSTPELLEWFTPQHRRDIEMKQLGRLKRFDGVHYLPNPDWVNNDDSIIAYSYQSVVNCENGSAKFTLNLIKQDEKWRIFGFYITPCKPGEYSTDANQY
jgi:hypothetical protein